MRKNRWLTALAVLLLASCGGGGGDDGGGGGGGEDQAVSDGKADLAPEPEDSSGPDGAEVLGDLLPEDQPPADGGGGPADLGFTVRLPRMHELECESSIPGFPSEALSVLDTDWICTFDHGGTSGHVYVQATPTECQMIMSSYAIFEISGAWLSIDGEVTALPLEQVGYDWGGNHQNNWFEFGWNDTHYKYYHSSFGSGWRACQPMDCLQVLDAFHGEVTEDGCTMERTLPAVCVQVTEKGDYPPLVDKFKPCDGDPNYE